jgi:hypothetical protein
VPQVVIVGSGSVVSGQSVGGNVLIEDDITPRIFGEQIEERLVVAWPAT